MQQRCRTGTFAAVLGSRISGSVAWPVVIVMSASGIASIGRSEYDSLLSARGEIPEVICGVNRLAAGDSSNRSSHVTDEGEEDRVESMTVLFL